MKGFMKRLFKRKKTLIATTSLIAVFLMCFLVTSRMYADTIPNVNGSVEGTDLLYEFTGSDRTLRIYVDTAGTTNNTTVSNAIWDKLIFCDNPINEQYVEKIIFDNSSGLLKINPDSLFFSGSHANHFYYCTSIDLTNTTLVPTTRTNANQHGMFFYMKNLREIKFSGDKTLRNIGVDAGGMFRYTAISDFDEILEGFDFSNVETLSYMFDGCDEVTSIDLGKMNLDETKYLDISNAFQECDKLTNVDFGDATLGSVKLSNTFAQCPNLEEVDLTCVSRISTLYAAFEHAPKLEKVYFGNTTFLNDDDDDLEFSFDHAFMDTAIESFNFTKTPDSGEANTINLSSYDQSINFEYMFYGCKSLKSVSLNGLNNSEQVYMHYMLYDCKNVEMLDLRGVNFTEESDVSFFAGTHGVDIIMLPDTVHESLASQWIGSGYYPVTMTGDEPSQSDIYSDSNDDVVITLQAKGTYDYYKKGPSLSDMITASLDKEKYDEEDVPEVSFDSGYACIDLENTTWEVEGESAFSGYIMPLGTSIKRLYLQDSDDEHFAIGFELYLNALLFLHLPNEKIRIDFPVPWLSCGYQLYDSNLNQVGDSKSFSGYIEFDVPNEGDYFVQFSIFPNEIEPSPEEQLDLISNPYKYCYFEMPKSIVYYPDSLPGELGPGSPSGTFDADNKKFVFSSFNKETMEGNYKFTFIYESENSTELNTSVTLASSNNDVLVKVKNPDSGSSEKTEELIPKTQNTFTTKLTPSGDNDKADIDVYKKDLTTKEYEKVPVKCVTNFDVSGGKDFTADFIDGDYKFVVTFKKGSAPGPSPNPPGGGGGGGSSGGGSTVSSPKVTFNLLPSNSSENASLLKSNEKELKKIIFDGNKIKTLPSALNRDGFVFDGWYKDKEFKEEVKLGDSLQGNVTLYANWKEIGNFTPYIRGYDDGEFKPNRYLSRAEVATIISRLSDEFDEDENLGNDSFPDTKKNFWYSNYIKFASDNKFFEGYPDGEFKPDRTITRGELVKVLVSFSKIKLNDDEEKNLKTFSDISDVDFFKDMANMLLTKGLIKGYEDGSFKGNSPVTRAEACVMINSILESTGKTVNVSDKTLNFTDVKKTDWFYSDILKSVISN